MSIWRVDDDNVKIRELLNELKTDTSLTRVVSETKKYSDTLRAMMFKELLAIYDRKLKKRQLQLDDLFISIAELRDELPAICTEVAACTERLKHALATDRNVARATQMLKMAVEAQEETERCIGVHKGNCALWHFDMTFIKNAMHFFQETLDDEEAKFSKEETERDCAARHAKRQKNSTQQQYVEGIELSDKELGAMLNEYAALDEEDEGTNEYLNALEAFVRDPGTGKWRYSVEEMERLVLVRVAREIKI